MKTILSVFVLCLSTSMLSAALPGAEALAKMIAKEFDTNSDSIIDQGEWQSGIAGGFKKLDINNDNTIKPEEVDNLSDEIAEEAGDIAGILILGLIKQALLGLDSDGDKAVSRKEYDKLATDIFTKIDADKNTNLTIDELSELPTKLILK